MLDNLGVCLPDYFGGSPNPFMAISVWKDMTKEQLTDAIISEYNMTWDHLTWEGARKPWPKELTDEQLQKECDEFILNDTPFATMDIQTLEESSEDDCCDSVMIHIGWEDDER